MRKRRRASAKAQPQTEDITRLDEWGLTRSQQRLLMVLGVVAGVLVAAVALTLAISAIGNDFVPEQATAPVIGTEPRPDVYKGWPSSKVFAPIAQSKADPGPLTVKELFAARTLKEGRITLRLAGTRLEADCAMATWGQGLADLLAQGGCTQVARGLYVSADGRYVAQYTLFNLRDTASADTLVNALTTLHRGGWVRPLQATRAVFPAEGHTEAGGHAMGHYAGLVWIGRTDGAEPGPRDDFVSLALTIRSVEKTIFRRVVAASPAPAPSK
ncbi:hypothetical protein OG884_30065 [Streptosporangium sp. NBC_01755]|uniref:hypothetical protein n=1 Tax=unclassified Streptosporangium TaxID=2632669 RepID=UPI002DDC0EC7|nr:MULTISPECIES: hypothetical protein [unclassified Streptosporangium]WSA22796.1 hypothetical protein OIE13_17520 [Streptosporangium sp. NBC_01810]WSC99060.1 hypothetical protein OG884_30065 [Streptosporangium sp. NBC_01755]